MRTVTVHQPRAPGILLPRDVGMRVPGSHLCEVPSGSSRWTPGQSHCCCFSCPLADPPFPPPSASDAGGFASRRVVLAPSPSQKKAPLFSSASGAHAPSDPTDLHHPKTQPLLSHGSGQAWGQGQGQPPTTLLGSGSMPRDTGVGHRGCQGMELLCSASRDGRTDGGMLYSQTSHLMAF